jgi:nitroreductase
VAALNPPGGNPALELLLGRRSCHRLTSPGPAPDELALIFAAALRAPDFGHLRPFRFLAAQGEGLDRLGQAMERAAIAAAQPQKIIARAPRMPHRAPLVIVVAASPKPHQVVPVFDQQLCAASTVLMMQLAARTLGYGGIWRSGWLMHDRGLHRELGLSDAEQIVGFLYLGTPTAHRDAEPPPESPNDVLVWL